VTLPTSDDQSPRVLSQNIPSTHSIYSIPTNHSIPATPVPSPLSSASLRPLATKTETSSTIARERATEFATHPWDLATGGLKILTAKRELPTRLERRTSNLLSDTSAAPKSYTFPLVILACIVIMLISGGIVLFMMLQP
jgi:hypothetical protein